MATLLNPYYAIQPAFTGGEISNDVASRVDLDKYQLSLLQAENAVVRPYGAVRKRPGMIYCGNTKKQTESAILYRFEFSVEISYLLEIGAGYIRIWRDGRYIGVEVETPYTTKDLPNLRFVQSVDVLYICSGTYPVQKLMRYSEQDWRVEEADWSVPPYGDINPDEDNKVSASALTGTITLTATEDTFSDDRIGESIKLEHYVTGGAVNLQSGGASQSGELTVGKSWKVITHGTWNGRVEIQQKPEKSDTWKTLRIYTSKDDYNPTESGDVGEYSQLRIITQIYSGTVTVDLTSYPYTHIGYATITAVSDAKTATATVTKKLGSTDGTTEWYWQAWSKTNGYPKSAAFFQDRLCFGGCTAYPQRVWMSRSGDYENFDIDKEEGTVTDDSMVSADLLSLKAYAINHMSVGNDLVIFTEGNTWTISGAETVTPSKITPRNQENYGTNEVAPMRVGNRIIYVQRRGSVVRDIGYRYDSDSYAGMDLTLLAKHLIRGRLITAGTYAQEPDSTLYFVTDDGELICLTYLVDQKVYAWSHFKTDGEFVAVSNVSAGNIDRVYAIVKRTHIAEGEPVTWYSIECFDEDHTSDNQQDYIMLDCAQRTTFSDGEATITGLERLNGKEVRVLGDGYLFEPMTVEDGSVTLPVAVKDAIVGLPYTMILEQPNFDAGNTDSGTVQGRKKTITTAIYRLDNSFGGRVGPDKEHLNEIVYDSERLETGGHVLYSGDKSITLAAGGFNVNGRTYLLHDKPYPFNVSAIIREVTFGG